MRRKIREASDCGECPYSFPGVDLVALQNA